MAQEIVFTHTSNLEQLLTASSKYQLTLTYLVPPLEIEPNKLYIYLDTEGLLTYAAINAEGIEVRTKINASQDKPDLPPKTAQSITKVLQNSPAKLSERDKRALFELTSKKGFSPTNEVISTLYDEGGFLTSRDDARFLTIATEMLDYPALNSYILIKKPDQPWNLMYVDAQGDVSKVKLDELEAIVVNKNEPKDFTGWEEKQIREIIGKFDCERGLEQLKKDAHRNWKINNNKEKGIPTIEKYPGLENYVPYHNQSLAGAFKMAFTSTLQGASDVLVVAENHHANINIENEKNGVTTDNSILLLGILGEPVLAWIPGHMQTNFSLATESGKTGQKFESFKGTNSVLQDLFSGNIHFDNLSDNEAIQKELDALKERATKEETPTSLYQWYKKMADVFLMGSAPGSLLPPIQGSGLSFVDSLSQFIKEFNQFLIKNNMSETFAQDKGFSENFKKIMSHVLENNISAAHKMVVLSFLGDGKKGNAQAEETNAFNDLEFRKYLGNFETVAERLEALEEIFITIKENKNQMYTPADTEKNLTELQQKHITILKNAYVEIALSDIEDSGVKAEIAKRGGLLDFSEDPKCTTTKEREELQNKLDEKFKYAVNENSVEANIVGSVKDNFGQDLARKLGVNGHQFSSVETVENYAKEKKYSALESYIQYHSQGYMGNVNNKINENITEKSGFVLFHDENYRANVEANNTSARCVAESGSLPLLGNNEFFSIPGHSQSVVELEDKDNKKYVKTTVQFSNTALKDLYENKVAFIKEYPLHLMSIKSPSVLPTKAQLSEQKRETPLLIRFQNDKNEFSFHLYGINKYNMNENDLVKLKGKEPWNNLNFENNSKIIISDVKNPEIFKKFENSTIVLELQRETSEKNKKTMKNLVNRAKQEELPGSLYQWYKEQAKLFLNNEFKNTVEARGVDYSKLLQNFYFETYHFLVHDNEMAKKFYADSEFSTNLEKIKIQFGPVTKIKLLVMAYLGDGRRGNSGKEKIDRFNKEKIENLLKDINDPAEKLKILEETFEKIQKNEDDLYTHSGTVGRALGHLTTAQYEHIGILKDLYVEIIETALIDPKTDSIVKVKINEMANNKQGLVDFNRSNAPNILKSDETATRKKVNKALELKAPQPKLTPQAILDGIFAKSKNKKKGPFDLGKVTYGIQTPTSKDAVEADRKVRPISIEDIVEYILENPQTAQFFFKPRPAEYGMPVSRNFSEEVSKQPALMKKLFVAAGESSNNDFINTVKGLCQSWSIEDIVEYTLKNPQVAQLFFKPISDGSRNFSEEIHKKPALMKKLFVAAEKSSDNNFITAIESLLDSPQVKLNVLYGQFYNSWFDACVNNVSDIPDSAEKLKVLEEMFKEIKENRNDRFGFQQQRINGLNELYFETVMSDLFHKGVEEAIKKTDGLVDFKTREKIEKLYDELHKDAAKLKSDPSIRNSFNNVKAALSNLDRDPLSCLMAMYQLDSLLREKMPVKDLSDASRLFGLLQLAFGDLSPFNTTKFEALLSALDEKIEKLSQENDQSQDKEEFLSIVSSVTNFFACFISHKENKSPGEKDGEIVEDFITRISEKPNDKSEIVRDVKEIDEYREEVIAESVEYQTQKENCLQALKAIQNEELKEALKTKVNKFTGPDIKATPLPDKEQMETFVNQINRELDADSGLTNDNYHALCYEKSDNGVPKPAFFVVMAGDIKIPSEGYKNDYPKPGRVPEKMETGSEFIAEKERFAEPLPRVQRSY